MGGGEIVYVFPFFMGKRETHKQNSQKSQEKAGRVPGQSRENFVCVFSCLLVFPGPNLQESRPGIPKESPKESPGAFPPRGSKSVQKSLKKSPESQNS